MVEAKEEQVEQGVNRAASGRGLVNLGKDFFSLCSGPWGAIKGF